MGDFNAQNLRTSMTLWALSRCESLKDAWSLFDHAKRICVCFSLLCFGALLMECEQRGLFEHEISLSKGLEGAASNHGAEMQFEICCSHAPF